MGKKIAGRPGYRRVRKSIFSPLLGRRIMNSYWVKSGSKKRKYKRTYKRSYKKRSTYRRRPRGSFGPNLGPGGRRKLAALGLVSNNEVIDPRIAAGLPAPSQALGTNPFNRIEGSKYYKAASAPGVDFWGD